jgi:hypothetical protein
MKQVLASLCAAIGRCLSVSIVCVGIGNASVVASASKVVCRLSASGGYSYLVALAALFEWKALQMGMGSITPHISLQAISLGFEVLVLMSHPLLH